MTELQEFHQKISTSNRQAKLIIGAIILVLLAGLGTYAYRLEVRAQPHPVVADNNLPSP